MKSVSDKTIENQSTYYIYHNFFNHAFCETMWKNILPPGRPQMTVSGCDVGCVRLQSHSRNM